MPLSRKPGESAEACMNRAMHENYGHGTAGRKKHKYNEALAISMSQCGLSKTKDAADWDFIFKVKYKDEISQEKKDETHKDHKRNVQQPTKP